MVCKRMAIRAGSRGMGFLGKLSCTINPQPLFFDTMHGALEKQMSATRLQLLDLYGTQMPDEKVSGRVGEE